MTGSTRKMPCFLSVYRRFLHRYRRYPSRYGKWKYPSRQHDDIFINDGIHTLQGIFIIMPSHDNLLINKESLFARRPAPDIHFITVTLGVDTSGQIHHPLRNRRRIMNHFFQQKLMAEFFGHRLFIRLAQRGVYKGFHTIWIFQRIQPVINNLYPVVKGL